MCYLYFIALQIKTLIVPKNVLRNYYLVLTVVNVDIQVAKHMQVLLLIMKLKLIYVSQLVLM